MMALLALTMIMKRMVVSPFGAGTPDGLYPA
jgi:hypothetical protein